MVVWKVIEAMWAGRDEQGYIHVSNMYTMIASGHTGACFTCGLASFTKFT